MAQHKSLCNSVIVTTINRDCKEVFFKINSNTKDKSSNSVTKGNQ